MAYQWFATPRRLAVLIPDVLDIAADQQVEEKMMPVSVAIGADGTPTPALLKKLEAKGIAASELPKFTKRMDGKSETFFLHHAGGGCTPERCPVRDRRRCAQETANPEDDALGRL